jgi:hypothetical protein
MVRRQRFSNLLAGLNYLRPVTGGTVSAEAPAGTPLRNFQEYRAGRTRRTITRTAASNPGASKERYLELFSADFVDATAKTSVSGRAVSTGLTQIAGLTPTILGWAETGTAKFNGEFIPLFSSNRCWRRNTATFRNYRVTETKS